MKTTIDSAGRLVVPKPIRDALGLRGGEQLDVSLGENGRLELAVPTTPMHLERRGHGVVAVADRKMPTLTQDLVRETLERTRR